MSVSAYISPASQRSSWSYKSETSYLRSGWSGENEQEGREGRQKEHSAGPVQPVPEGRIDFRAVNFGLLSVSKKYFWNFFGNFYQIPNKCLLDTTCIVICVTGSTKLHCVTVLKWLKMCHTKTYLFNIYIYKHSLNNVEWERKVNMMFICLEYI